MNLTLKAGLLKAWTLLDDKIIYGDREILFSEIQGIKVFSKPKMGLNGVIQLVVGGKVLNLAYSGKYKKEGEEAIEYLFANFLEQNQEVNEQITRIQKEIDELECKDDWGTRKEIAELPRILAQDEHIKALTSGVADGNTWLVVCTDKRVLLLDKGMLYGLKIIDIPLDRINSISHSIGLVFGKISITDGAVTRTIDNISVVTVSFFADVVNKEVELYKNTKNKSLNQVSTINSVADELIKYKQLLDMGALTEEEFSIKKKELLKVV